VIFGKAGAFNNILELSSLDGDNGFKMNGGQAADRTGFSVSQAGDINGDGFSDLIVGALGADPNGISGAGTSYLVFGKETSFSATLNLNSLNNDDGFQINGESSYDYAGISVSQAGDINGDGLGDLIIGAPFVDLNGAITNSGASYVVFGQVTSFNRELQLSSLNGINGFQINGEQAEDRCGFSVSQAGDVNGDGLDDLVLGAAYADRNETNSGSSYVIYGRDYSPQGDFTANCAPDLLTRKGKALRLLPLTIDSNQVVKAELPAGTTLSLPTAIAPSGDKLPKKTKLRTALDFDNGGVSDFLVQTNKNALKLFKLINNGSPVTPTVLSEVNFAVPKKHRYLGAGPLSGEDNKLDLMFRKGKALFVAANLDDSFSTNLQPITGKLKGKILSIQKGRIITAKGRKLSQQSISNLVLEVTTQIGKLAKGQKPLLMLDINQDGKLDVVTLGKKRSVGFVSADNLAAIPTPIVTLPKKTKVIGPK